MNESNLWEGARRLPYFFSYGGNTSHSPRRAIMCPQCVLERLADHEMLQPHYHVSRSVMCSRCNILIGPINDEEVIEP